MDVTTLGIDLAKNVFQLHGIDKDGIRVIKKRLSRSQLPRFIQQLPPTQIALEACGSAHYWARRFQAMGHNVKLLAPQFVKPFLIGDKNDGNDARAICQTRLCKDMRYVPIKSLEQQDIQAMHRHRSLLVKQRTQLANQIRGLLAEYGQIIPKQIQFIRKRLPEIIENTNNELTVLSRELFNDLYQQMRAFDEKVKHYDKKLEHIAKNKPECANLLSLPGVGPKTATAMFAAIGTGHEFKNGRQFAAWCGLVPKQHSSGERVRLGKINKRGNAYLRTLLIHGARCVIRFAAREQTPLQCWTHRKCQRAHINSATVALANKHARILWVMLNQGVEYQQALTSTAIS